MIRYVTRWALSTGIRKVTGSYTKDMYFTDGYFTDGRGIFVSAREAFETVELAQQEARRLADRRIASFKKQIAKLESPSWTAKVVE